MLALVIDQETSDEVYRINQTVGRGARYVAYRNRLFHGDSYKALLEQYVQLKLELHQQRKSMYYPWDAYMERSGVDAILAKIRVLRAQIKEARAAAQQAAWGDLMPQPIPQPLKNNY